ncbi:unnamed protein product [Haemonchus placei]|uniref:Secreted protein n=1 Tax=Haemonchus placei TaxID=6290 RepID=A0A0N4WVN4_HAEPC|nr:unnamed protein product [Haemonchus placei]
MFLAYILLALVITAAAAPNTGRETSNEKRQGPPKLVCVKEPFQGFSSQNSITPTKDPGNNAITVPKIKQIDCALVCCGSLRFVSFLLENLKTYSDFFGSW